MANNIIDRSALSGLIPEPVTREIMQGAIAESAVLRMARRLPNMSSKTQTINVLDALPSAYFVNGEADANGNTNAFKKITNMKWDKKKIYAEEIAVIVPIPEAVLSDSNYDIWGEVRPRLNEAFGKVIDKAILFGTDKPTTWRDGILASAETAGNTLTATTDIYGDIMGESGLKLNGIISKVESLINVIIGGVNWLITQLNKIHFTVPDWVPGLGGEYFGFNIPLISEQHLPRIPALAKGAVIPPNREFLAVLGDQKSGTNIETPLDTMVGAFRQALAQDGYGGNAEMLDVMVSLLTYVRSIADSSERTAQKDFTLGKPSSAAGRWVSQSMEAYSAVRG